MEYHSLILGVLLSIGIFAVKSGAGLAYFFEGQSNLKNKVTGFILFSTAYMIVFLAAMLLIKKIDPVTHLMSIQQFIKSGMLIHIVMAFLMIVWGVILLRHNKSHHKRSRGWMLLALPCPVCITVIFISTAFLITLYPDAPLTAAGGLYVSFTGINIITVFAINIYSKHQDIEPESFLGNIMLFIAVYFILSVSVMPHFSDIDKVYRLAMYKGREQSKELLYFTPCLVLTVLAFASGFIFKYKRIIRRIL